MAISKEAQKLDDMMRKVEGLLATADSFEETNPEAAANYRNNAERIMVKYRIEQEDLIARGDLRVDGLNVMFKEVRAYNWASEFSQTYRTLISYAAHHAGVKVVFTGYDGDSRITTMIGYESDIRYAEALYMGARLVFADRMEPKVDPNLSDEQNCYRLRSAGIERGRIGEMMNWGDKAHQKVTRVYKRACAALGEEPVLTGKGNSVKDFREGYATGFRSEFWSRLSVARIAVENEIENGGLTLHGREERIQEAVYERWPQLRPSTVPATTSTKPARARKWTKADQRQWERANSGASLLGRNSGAAAASEIDLSSNSTPRKRIN